MTVAKKQTRRSVSLSADVHADTLLRSELQGISLSQYVTNALAAYRSLIETSGSPAVMTAREALEDEISYAQRHEISRDG